MFDSKVKALSSSSAYFGKKFFHYQPWFGSLCSQKTKALCSQLNPPIQVFPLTKQKPTK